MRTGDVIAGKYILLNRIAQGAMGTVWSARNTTLDVLVAIKVVHPHVKYPFVAPALLWEAQATCRLSHPAIVKVYDYGETTSGETFIVMEHLVGETLRELLEREKRLSAIRAVKLLLPIAEGLHAAHASGITHRDLKPENIVLTMDRAGRVHPKLIDFGVAKLSWVDGSWGTTVVGTPGYMPLEQICGENIDHRADVWAFSAVLHEAIAGALPFESATVNEAVRALQNDPIPSLRARVSVDDTLSHIVERGLRRHVADRWSSIDELAAALTQWLASHGTPASGRPPRSRALLDESALPTAPLARPRVRDELPSVPSLIIPGATRRRRPSGPRVGWRCRCRIVATARSTAAPSAPIRRRGGTHRGRHAGRPRSPFISNKAVGRWTAQMVAAVLDVGGWFSPSRGAQR